MGVPRIGLTTYREAARWGEWDRPADLLPTTYADAVTAAGAAALLLPAADPALADAVLDGLHGLVISGGSDVDPDRYDAVRDEHTGAPRPDRDAWELALAGAAIARDLPVLGICRGMQVINVARGGDLIQHLPDQVGHDAHSPQLGEFGRHPVRLAEASRVAALTADPVPTHHHQSVGRLGTGLVATGWAEDGVVEAMELPDRTWVVCVQWHPEVGGGAALFADFVAAARSYAERA